MGVYLNKYKRFEKTFTNSAVYQYVCEQDIIITDVEIHTEIIILQEILFILYKLVRKAE